MIFIYQAAWTLAVIAALPVAWILGSRRFQERVFPDLPSESLSNGTIWIHALSVGEVLSALPLLESLRERYPHRAMVFTVTTSKGMEVARDVVGDRVRALLFMPVDFWWSIRRVVRWIHPEVFLLIETDLWPGLLSHLRRKGIKSILINGRVSPRTLHSYLRFPGFVRTVFGLLEKCLMQSELDRQRLMKVGVDPNKIEAVGNIKFDRRWEPMEEQERKNWMSTLQLRPQDTVWVAGSTHHGEEEIILKTLSRLRPSFPGLVLIIAPRRIEEANEIVRKASEMGFHAVLRSQMAAAGRSDVIVLDTLGELDRVYGLGKVAFVGGSLVPFGGHNVLEPANFGCAVLFGPHTHNFVTMCDALEEAGAAWRVSDGDDLTEKLRALLEDGQLLNGMGARAKQFVQENRGAVQRVLQDVEPLLGKPETRENPL